MYGVCGVQLMVHVVVHGVGVMSGVVWSVVSCEVWCWVSSVGWGGYDVICQVWFKWCGVVCWEVWCDVLGWCWEVWCGVV